jgi:hypothetical protein
VPFRKVTSRLLSRSVNEKVRGEYMRLCVAIALPLYPSFFSGICSRSLLRDASALYHTLTAVTQHSMAQRQRFQFLPWSFTALQGQIGTSLRAEVTAMPFRRSPLTKSTIKDQKAALGLSSTYQHVSSPQTCTPNHLEKLQ